MANVTVVLDQSYGGSFGGYDSPKKGDSVSIDSTLADALNTLGYTHTPPTLIYTPDDGYEYVKFLRSFGGTVGGIDSPRKGQIAEVPTATATALIADGRAEAVS